MCGAAPPGRRCDAGATTRRASPRGFPRPAGRNIRPVVTPEFVGRRRASARPRGRAGPARGRLLPPSDPESPRRTPPEAIPSLRNPPQTPYRFPAGRRCNQSRLGGSRPLRPGRNDPDNRRGRASATPSAPRPPPGGEDPGPVRRTPRFRASARFRWHPLRGGLISRPRAGVQRKRSNAAGIGPNRGGGCGPGRRILRGRTNRRGHLQPPIPALR